MSATNAPFGLRAVKHLAGGQIRIESGTIAAADTTAIYSGDLVSYTTAGVISKTVSGVSNGAIGVFMGCTFTDASGQAQVRAYWPGTAGATNIVAQFTTDPLIVYEIQADGAVAQANVGEQTTFNTSTGSTITGLSNATLASASLSASTANQLRVLAISTYPDNAAGDAFTVVQVQIALHQFVNRQGPF
jgi:hypothetical protein